jgi:hypothetical protein
MGNAESLLQYARDGNLNELKNIGDVDEVINCQNQVFYYCYYYYYYYSF